MVPYFFVPWRFLHGAMGSPSELLGNICDVGILTRTPSGAKSIKSLSWQLLPQNLFNTLRTNPKKQLQLWFSSCMPTRTGFFHGLNTPSGRENCQLAHKSTWIGSISRAADTWEPLRMARFSDPHFCQDGSKSLQIFRRWCF